MLARVGGESACGATGVFETSRDVYAQGPDEHWDEPRSVLIWRFSNPAWIG